MSNIDEVRSAIDNFDFDRARELLRNELASNPNAESYYFASLVALNDEQKINFLTKAVDKDPFHLAATSALAKLQPKANTTTSSDLGAETKTPTLQNQALPKINAKQQSSIDLYKQTLSHYANFSGRARRKEFWSFSLINTLLSILFLILDTAIFPRETRNIGIGPVSILFSLALFIPSIAVAARRLHDTGRSGWYWWLGVIPIIGTILLLVYFLEDSKSGTNLYGPNPKEA